MSIINHKLQCTTINNCCEDCYKEFKEQQTNCDHYFPRGNDGGLRPCEFCNEEKVIRFFNLDGYYNEIVYLEGQSSLENSSNPYIKNTNSWFNWNKGRNERT
jgi:hypothetical protein